MSYLILAVDLGTTALKIALFDFEGKMKARANYEYNLLTPYPNHVEANPEIYMKALRECIKNINSKEVDLMKIRAVGFSNQGETLFFVDKSGYPLRNGIVWMDNRAEEEAKYLKELIGDEECYKRTGQVSFEPCWPASKVLWVKNNEPEIFDKTSKILLVEDYIISQLTGEYVSEGSLLTSTEYWDINSKKYWSEMLEVLGVSEDYFPNIMESGEVVGKIMPSMAEYLGINPEALICTGCLDQAAGAIGVGNINKGMFSENIGAALAICAPTGDLTLDPNRTMPVHYFPIQDTYMMHTFTTGGMTLRWFRDSFCGIEMRMSELLKEDSYSLLSKEAEIVPPGSEGLVMLPHLNGSMAPDMHSNAKGVFYGFSLKHKRGHFIRAIMESIGYVLNRNIEALMDMGIKVEEVRSLGGGSRSEVWNQIKADIIKRPLLTMQCKEEACLGAAILAGKAIGEFKNIQEACSEMVKIDKKFEPNKNNFDIYDKSFSYYKELFKNLLDLFDTTAQK